MMHRPTDQTARSDFVVDARRRSDEILERVQTHPRPSFARRPADMAMQVLVLAVRATMAMTGDVARHFSSRHNLRTDERAKVSKRSGASVLISTVHVFTDVLRYVAQLLARQLKSNPSARHVAIRLRFQPRQ